MGGFLNQQGGFLTGNYLPLTGGTVSGALTVTGVATLSGGAAITGASTLTVAAVGTAQTAGLTLQNTTDAADGAQQYSPMLALVGEGWKSGSSVSQVARWALQTRPVQGVSAPTSVLDFLESIDASSYTSRMNLTSGTSPALTVGATTNKAVMGDALGTGYPGIWFGNVTPSTSNFNFLYDSSASGGTIFNSQGAAQKIYFQIQNQTGMNLMSNGGWLLTMTDGLGIGVGSSSGTKIGTATSQKIGLWNATPVIQQVGGVTLTNNVTSGGTSNQLDDVVAAAGEATASDLTTTRNAIYQLGRKLKLVTDALRTIGALANADA